MKRLLFLLLLIPQLAEAAPAYFWGAESGDITEIQAITGTASVQSTTKRTGTYAFRVNPTTTATGSDQIRGLGTSGTTSTSAPNTACGYARFYFYIATAPAATSEEIAVIRNTGDTADKSALRLTSARLLAYYVTGTTLSATGTVALATSTWYRVEFKSCNGTSASYQFDLYNDPTTGNGTGAAALLESVSGTANQAATNVGMLVIGKVTNRNGNTVDFYYDDVYYDDAAFPGPGKILRLGPTGNGSTAQWTSGTASDHTPVDEVVEDGDTTYLANTASANQTHELALENTATVGISSGATIKAVAAMARCRETSVVTNLFQVGLLSGGTESHQAADRDLTSSFATVRKLLTTDPADSLAWTIADVDAVQVRIKEVGAFTDRCTTVYGMVDFQPPLGGVIHSLIASGDY